MNEVKRFQKVELNPDDYADIVRAANWTRKHFPWLIKIVGLFVKE